MRVRFLSNSSGRAWHCAAPRRDKWRSRYIAGAHGHIGFLGRVKTWTLSIPVVYPAKVLSLVRAGADFPHDSADAVLAEVNLIHALQAAEPVGRFQARRLPITYRTKTNKKGLLNRL